MISIKNTSNIFADYTNIDRLGKGAQGVVLLVKNNQSGENCAMKLIDIECLNEKEKTDVRNEGLLLASIGHPNIVNVIDLLETNSKFCIVLELVNGGDLKAFIQNQGKQFLPEKKVLNFMIQISRALAYLHERKILHRDLKPENIMLTENGQLKVADFGLAR